MGKLLESLIKREIEESISILKRKKILKEAPPSDDQDLLASLTGDTSGADPNTSPTDAAGDPFQNSGGAPDPTGADPMASDSMTGSTNPDGGDPLTGDATSTEEVPEEEKDPLDASFDEVKELSDKTEDVTKIVKAIKAKIQDGFDTVEEAEQFIQKIESEGTPIMKKALARPELSFVKKSSI